MTEPLTCPTVVTCPTCGGHGADPLSDNVNWRPCNTCGGSGLIKAPDAPRLKLADLPVRLVLGVDLYNTDPRYKTKKTQAEIQRRYRQRVKAKREGRASC